MSSHKLFGKLDLSALPAGAWVVEVGSQREPQPAESDDNSTTFLMRLADAAGLRFATVDFSQSTFEHAQSFVGDAAHLADGATFIRDLAEPIAILYLDNFDVVYNEKHKASLMSRVGTVYEDNAEEINNERAAQVHLEQALAALPLLTKPAYVGFDDTMVRDGELWGKGATAVPYLLEKGFSVAARGDDGLVLKTPE